MARRLTEVVVAVATIALFGVGHVPVRYSQAQPATTGVDSFDRIATVLQGPRCLNCHPRGDRPRQDDDRHIHLMNAQRGTQNMGVPAMRCVTCHQSRNNDMAGIPGAPHWQLAPVSMAWEGLSKGELCRTLLDPSKNGGRSVAALVQHMTGDALVLWAWNPGRGRTLPTLSVDEFKAALDQWAAAGAPCPN
jgi:hypothetical protein